jgi:hypothetical protein
VNLHWETHWYVVKYTRICPCQGQTLRHKSDDQIHCGLRKRYRYTHRPREVGPTGSGVWLVHDVSEAVSPSITRWKYDACFIGPIRWSYSLSQDLVGLVRAHAGLRTDKFHVVPLCTEQRAMRGRQLIRHVCSTGHLKACPTGSHLHCSWFHDFNSSFPKIGAGGHSTLRHSCGEMLNHKTACNTNTGRTEKHEEPAVYSGIWRRVVW